MNKIKSILATVAILGLSVNTFAMDDDNGSVGAYMTGADQATTSSAPALNASLGGADYFLTLRHENR